MADGVRIAQQLSAGYNPDGTPGTVQTALQGPPGPPPSDDQVLAAVTQYLQTNPITDSAAGFKKLSTGVVTNHADQMAIGVGVDGSGSWVGMGTYGSTVDGYVFVDGSTDNADLHLKSKGPKGRIWVNSPITSNNSVVIDQGLTVNRDLTIAGTLSATGGWFLQSTYVAMAPSGGSNNDGSVSVYDPSTVGGTVKYWPVYASGFVTASDPRLKDDATRFSGGLDEVLTTPVYSYVMNGEQRRGLMADEAPPSLVREGMSGYQLIDLYDMVGTLWNAVQELAAKGMED